MYFAGPAHGQPLTGQPRIRPHKIMKIFHITTRMKTKKEVLPAMEKDLSSYLDITLRYLAK